MYKYIYFQVFLLSDSKWICEIIPTKLGLSEIIFSNDSRYILTATNFNLFIAIYSLVDDKILYLQNPKDINSCSAFGDDIPLFIYIHTHQSKDILNIVDTSEWKVINQFNLKTQDCSKVN